MTCEKAEDFLSAYLDDMLDPQHRREVEAHLQSCAACRAVLEDYRRFDVLLVQEPRVAPPEELYARIVESPEFVAITRTRERSERRGMLTALRPVARIEAKPLAAPDVVQGESPGTAVARGRRGVPGLARVALQTAAVLALILGSALLIKQGFFHSGGTTGQGVTQTYGAAPQNGAPLSAGARVVYKHDGALWSAPEAGPQVAQRLTPAGVLVGGWSVSPDGTLVAYVDEHSGRLLVIRSDDQNNHVVGQVLASNKVNAAFWETDAGAAIDAGIAWAPNGERIAYLAAGVSTTATRLHLVNVDGSNDAVIDAGSAALIAQPTWSTDGLQIAYTGIVNGAQGVFSYNTVMRQVTRLAAQADADDALARVDRLIWLPDTASPALTWATRNGSAFTGIFSTPTPQGSAKVLRLTPAGMRFTAVAYTGGHDGGTWAVAPVNGNPTLYTVSAHVAGLGLLGSPQGEVRAIQWSPTGDRAAFVTVDGRLGLWSPWSASATGAFIVSDLGHVVSGPAWSRDGARLAVPTAKGIVSLRVVDGAVNGKMTVAAGDAVTLLWASDGKGMALVGSSGVTLVSSDGAVVKPVDAHTAQDGAIAWTLAG
ncbi:MAG: zf-HC2 domain-containing protein [Ktedonobacterales bacterium]